MATGNKLDLTVATVSGLLFSGSVASVTVPAASGELTLLARHEPLITTLKQGIITVRAEGGTQTFDITEGLLEVSNNNATVLV